MQLNLFQWDAIAVGNGYQCLSMLDFDKAGSHFSKVLKALPTHQTAYQGMKDLQFWEDVFVDMAGLDKVSQIFFLWDGIACFNFGSSDYYTSLRQTLIRHLLQLIGDDGEFYIPPDLCRGYLHLQLGDYRRAETSLVQLLEQFPADARLHSFLADAQYQQGKEGNAGISYATALLIAPDEVDVSAIRNRRLAEVVREHGHELAPIYGYFQGILPLVSLQTKLSSPEARAYNLLRQAEQAMRLGNHDKMVTARRDLKQLHPKVLEDYLSWLTSS